LRKNLWNETARWGAVSAETAQWGAVSVLPPIYIPPGSSEILVLPSQIPEKEESGEKEVSSEALAVFVGDLSR
jgi:hypothetical protein